MGLLDGMNNAGNSNPIQILQMLRMQNQDPFSRSLPGEGLLGQGNMSIPQMGQEQAQQDPMQQMNPEMMNSSAALNGGNLPNFPKSFNGFGLGQFAPKEQPANMRQQMIMQLLQTLPQMMTGGGF